MRILLIVLLGPLLTAAPVWGQATIPATADYQPITVDQRIRWVQDATVGVPSLIGGTISSGIATGLNRPTEYGPTWPGFGKRYGMRLTGVATSNAMEASLGVLWGEDPRYARAAPGDRFRKRVWNVVKMTFVAKNSLGENSPAFARYLSVYSSNYLSNTWRANSDSSSSDAAARVGLGFVGRMAGNAFQEFWPDAKRKLLRRK